VELALAGAPRTVGAVAVRGKAITPQTVEAGRRVRIVACEVDERVLGLRPLARRGGIAAARVELVREPVYIL
jgi:hypothetical protein